MAFKSDGRPPQQLIGQSALYKHRDSLLRRLRLEDPHGTPISNLEQAMEGKKVIVFYVSSVYGESSLRELQRDMVDLAFRQAKSCSIVYVSVDSQSSEQDFMTQNKPYLRLTFSDGSDFAPMASSEEDEKRPGAEVEEVMRGEEFISAEELGANPGLFKLGAEEDEDFYVRPLSRAAVCRVLNALATPSISVYHIPSHSFVASHVRPSAFRPNRIGENYAKWKGGGEPGWDVSAFWTAFRLPVLLALVALLYQLIVHFLGPEWNVVPILMEKLGELQFPGSSSIRLRPATK